MSKEQISNFKDFEHLELLVVNWAKEKGILHKATKMKQAIKTLEEVNELLTAIHDEDKPEIIDALGDILVTIIIQAEMNGLNLTDCLFSAYTVIAKRSGQMIRGEFIKD